MVPPVSLHMTFFRRPVHPPCHCNSTSSGNLRLTRFLQSGAVSSGSRLRAPRADAVNDSMRRTHLPSPTTFRCLARAMQPRS